MRLTVVTPTYNRAHTLQRCYDSLKIQTFKDFEWIVVDDGSEDETREMVKGFMHDAQFQVRYVYKPNGGKPSAVNAGVELARGEMLLVLDSDDTVPSNGFEKFFAAWDAISEARRAAYWCVIGLCQDSVTGQIVGDSFPLDRLSTSWGRLQFALKVHGEKWAMVRTELMKKHPYPESREFKFLPESYVWSELGRSYRCLCVNDVVRTYFAPKGNAHGNLSGRANGIRNAGGFILVDAQTLDFDMPNWFKRDPIYFCKRAANVARNALHKGSLLKGIKAVSRLRSKALVLLGTPIGFAYFVSDLLWFRFCYLPERSKMGRDTVGS